MANQGYSSLINNLPSAAYNGTALVSSNSLTDVSPAPNVTIAAGALMTGQVIRVTARVKFSTTGTPTVLFGLYWGGIAGVKVCAIGATTTASTASNFPVQVDGLITVNSVGTSGTITGSGEVSLGTSLTAWTKIPMDASAIAPVTVDTTVSKILTLGAQWGTLNALNTLTVVQWAVEGLN